MADDPSHPLHGYLQSSPDAIVLADPETRAIVDANRAAEDLLGYDREELTDMVVSDIHPPEEADRYRQLFDAHLEHEPAVISRFDDGSPVYVERADGGRVPVEINAWLTEIDGQPVLQGVFRDVSERVRREAEVERQNRRLEEFAGIVSHDLRNPLAVARGRAELASETCDSEHLEPLLEALDRMESIIEDTMTLARNGNRVGETQPVDVAGIAGDCWEMAGDRSATLDVVDGFTVRADPSRLKHVLENLFRNAVVHASDDVAVRVGLAGDDAFYVEDDGPGVPADRRDEMFEPGHTSMSGGTGFGLTIVRRLAAAHGWDVELTESEAGGARFEFHGVDVVR